MPAYLRKLAAQVHKNVTLEGENKLANKMLVKTNKGNDMQSAIKTIQEERPFKMKSLNIFKLYTKEPVRNVKNQIIVWVWKRNK